MELLVAHEGLAHFLGHLKYITDQLDILSDKFLYGWVFGRLDCLVLIKLIELSISLTIRRQHLHLNRYISITHTNKKVSMTDNNFDQNIDHQIKSKV